MSAGTARELKYCKSLGVSNKTVIPLALVGYETCTIIANLALGPFIGYLPSHIQRTLMEKLLSIRQYKILKDYIEIGSDPNRRSSS